MRGIRIYFLSIHRLVCRARIDLGFLLDGSPGRFSSRVIMQYIKETVRRFEVSSTRVRIGIVLYTSRPTLIMRFGRTYARVQIYRVVDRMQLRGRGGRYLGRALTYTGRYLFKSKPRCGRRRVLIVLTSGKSRDRIRRPARRLHASGVEIYAIGIGRVRRRSLLQIATGSRHVFNVAARRLVSITRIIKDRMCSSPGMWILCIISRTNQGSRVKYTLWRTDTTLFRCL